MISANEVRDGSFLVLTESGKLLIAKYKSP